MIPFCLIISNGIDVTPLISEYLLSITIKDEADDKSDTVEIILDDRSRLIDNAFLEIPLVGSIVEVTMGYREGRFRSMGAYFINDITVNSSPRTITINGKAAAMNTSYRTPRSQSYHQMTLGTIISTIANRHGYEAKLEPSLANIVIRHIDQHNESDMAFTTRLAGEHDAVAKPVDGKLVLAKKGTGKSISGEDLPYLLLNESMCSTWKFHYTARDEVGEANGLQATGNNDQQAAGERNNKISGSNVAPPAPQKNENTKQSTGGVRAQYHDIRTGQKQEVKSGSEPFHNLRYSYHNASEALAAIASYRNRSLRGTATFDFTIGGDPFVMAEARMTQLPIFRPYIPPHWRIKTATHTFNSSGYTTECNCELFDETQEDAAKNIKKSKPSTDDTIDPNAPPQAVEDANEGEGVIQSDD